VIAAPVITVVVDGRPVVAPKPAVLVGGMVSAPIDPYARLVATKITLDDRRGSVTFERGAARVTINVPYVRGDQARIPLGALARALGNSVRYDGAARTLEIDSPPLEPVATMSPYVKWTAPPGPLPTFTPEPQPTPRPSVTGIPQPRRTPIVVNGGQ
jgi:hypothetical protein